MKETTNEITALKQDKYIAIEAILGAISLLSWIEVEEPLNRIKMERIEELRMTLEAIYKEKVDPAHGVLKKDIKHAST